MRALDPEVQEAVWQAVEPLVPRPVVTHPLGCHRRRKSDRDCFQMMLVRFATGCSWEDAERLLAARSRTAGARAPRRMGGSRSLRRHRR